MVNKFRNTLAYLGTFAFITGTCYMILALLLKSIIVIEVFQFSNFFVALTSVIISLLLSKYYYLPSKS
jgi:hypothetical protein